jgi:hypothetical protein
LKIDIAADRQRKTSVAALLNNKAQNTIVICTPYIPGETNAGSASALVELIFSLKKNKHAKNNYLFIAFPDNKIDASDFTFFPNTVLTGLNIGKILNIGTMDGLEGAMITTPFGSFENLHAPVFFMNTQKTASQKIDSENELKNIRLVQRFVESSVKK